MPPTVAFLSAEMAPFAKTGGLGDVAAALPRYLHRAGHDVRPFLPWYGHLELPAAPRPVPFARDVPVRLGRWDYRFSLFETALPGEDLPVFLVSCPPLFDRREIYSARGDEHLRFALLTRAAVESCQRMGFAPRIFHANDWHTALLPLYLRTHYSWDRLFARTRTVLTLHNLAYQGVFPEWAVADLDLAPHAGLLHQEDLRAGRVSFLKTGLLHADAITAVSGTYAREILTPEHGFGLDGLLRARAGSLHGIANGIDTEIWSPERDALIPARYSAEDLSGKDLCRSLLLQSLGLLPRPKGPVLGMVTRLTAQKGIDLAAAVVPDLLAAADVRLVVLGGGDPGLVEFFRGLQRRFPGKAAFRTGRDEGLAHRIEAGADLFLMPSLFEPCGLNQMYSQRYGTPPVVRRTGGLADTVTHFDRRTGEGTGFVFDHPTAAGLEWALREALECWSDRRAWRRLQANGMAMDFSWERQAGRYAGLYASLS